MVWSTLWPRLYSCRSTPCLTINQAIKHPTNLFLAVPGCCKVAFRNDDGSIDVILSDGRIRQEIPPTELRLITRSGLGVIGDPEELEGKLSLARPGYAVLLLLDAVNVDHKSEELIPWRQGKPKSIKHRSIPSRSTR